MKKNIIIFLFCIMVSPFYSQEAESVNLRINYIDYELYTIIPLNETMLLDRSSLKEINISISNLKKIKDLIANRTEVSEINVVTGFNLDFLDNKKSDESFRKGEKGSVQKRPINDIDLNVRYVVKFCDGGKETKLLIGQSGFLIGIDDRFYKIPSENYYALLEILNSFIE